MNKPVEWIWRHIGVTLPPDWEMLQFSTEFNRGRCAFADRYQYRFELNWIVVKGEPDYTRMLSDYTSRLESEKRLTGTEMIKKSGWHGFHGEMGGQLTSRFVHYLGGIGSLVECVFLWPEKREPDVEASVLASIRDYPRDVDGRHRWRAFGLDMHPPATAAVDGCTTQPARAVFTCTNPKSGNKWHFARYGMVKSWLKTDVEAWLTRTMQNKARNLRFSHRRHQGADLVHAEGPFKPDGIHLKNGQLQTIAWINPEDGRLYHATQRIRREHPGETVPMESLLLGAPEFTPRMSP